MLKDILQYLQYIVDWITLHLKVWCTTVHYAFFLGPCPPWSKTPLHQSFIKSINLQQVSWTCSCEVCMFFAFIWVLPPESLIMFLNWFYIGCTLDIGLNVSLSVCVSPMIDWQHVPIFCSVSAGICLLSNDVSTLLARASSNWYNALQQVKAVAF